MVWLAVPHREAPTAIEASSPLASWGEYGSPARISSSVARGSNMRRKLTLPVLPPVAMITALLALIVTVSASMATFSSARKPFNGASLPGSSVGV